MRASEFVREDADAKQVLDYIHGTHHEPLTKQLQQAVLSYPRWELRSVPLSSLHIPDQEYDDEEQEPEADPYNRVQAIDPDHAGEYSANFVDRRPIVVDHEGWIIDGNHRAWAAAELLNRDSIQAWVPASQLNELGNAPAEYKPNRKRSRSLFHATVDGQWVDVFFDRSEFNDTLHITFAVNNNYDTPSRPTSASRSTVKILSTVLNIVKQKLPEYMAKAHPPAVSFTAKGDNRASLYRKYFVPVIQNVLGPKWQHEEYPSMGMTVFHWRPVKKQGVAEDAENFNGIDISIEVQDDEVMVRATAGGQELGHVLFVEEDEYLMPQDLEVEERFQGQGIAAAMYDYVKSKGYKIRRSGQQTDAGAGFWGKHRPEQNVWENFADGRNPQDKGDSKRHGINTKASVSSLRKTAKQGGRKGQLAHWLANMKAGRAKAKKK